jgi:hypothetical protein
MWLVWKNFKFLKQLNLKYMLNLMGVPTRFNPNQIRLSIREHLMMLFRWKHLYSVEQSGR